MKQLFKPEELLGKTIAQTIIDVDDNEDWWVKFTDNSFVVLCIRNLARVSYEHKEAISISDEIQDETSRELLALGIVSQLQHNQATKRKCEEHDKEYREKTLKQQQEIEEVERKQLAELKKKYEK